MKFEQTEALVSALENWNSVTKSKTQDFETLIRLVLFNMGYDTGFEPSDVMADLRSRVTSLIQEEGFDEDFIVMAIVQNVTDLLTENISRHGQRMLDLEQMTERLGEDPTEDSPINTSLKRFKEPGYLIQAEYELDVWKATVSTNLGNAKRAYWRHQKMSEAAHEIGKEHERVPKEIWDILKDLPVGKIFSMTTIDQLETMNINEAKLLRSQILEEKELQSS